jgi:monoamine oxidase
MGGAHGLTASPTSSDDPGAHCVVPAGMETFIERLSAPVKPAIRTNVCVTSIDYGNADGVVVVGCEDGSKVTADRVVVTCSLGFLKCKELTFSPELPIPKVEAIARSPMGQCMKVMVQFPEVFWPKNASFLTQIRATTTNRVHFPVIFSYYATKGAPILEGDLIGADAEEVSATYTDQEIAHSMFRQLQDTFGRGVPEPVGYFVTR